MNDIRHITKQVTITFDLIEQLGKEGGVGLFFLFSYFDTNTNLIYRAQYSLVIPHITSVKIPGHPWMTQRGQDTQDFIFLIFIKQSMNRF